MEENRAYDFLKKLQSLDEPTKRKVLIVSTIVIMIVVIFVWIAYFNNIIMPSSGGTATATSTQPVASAPAASGPGFWGKMKNDFSGFGEGVAEGFEGIGNAFHGGREYIKPSN